MYLTVLGISIVIMIILLIPVYFINKKNHSQLAVSVYLLFLIWAARSAVCLLGTIEGTEDFSAFEKILDSMVHAVQTFSMDEDYTAYTSVGKNILRDSGQPVMAEVYGCVISLLNICAPVLGGALLLDILTGLIPVLRLKMNPFCHKFVFSELNDMSLNLAEDLIRHDGKDINYKKIINMKKYEKPMFVFCGVNQEDNSALRHELMNKLKNYSCVCISSEISDVFLAKSKSVSYILISENPEENIIDFSAITKSSEENRIYPVSCHTKEIITKIYVFVHEDHEANIVKSIIKNNPEKEKMIVRIIRDYMNASVNLMNDVPLFLPLLDCKKKKDKLCVTVLGDGKIASEVFRTVYWCGQIPNVSLSVNVIGKNTDMFERTLREKCPEMLECCNPDSEKLRVYPDDPYTKNPPYIESCRFIQKENVHIISEYEEVIKETDYYVIALGTDKDNAALADILCSRIRKLALSGKSPEAVTIVPAVYNTELAKILKNKNRDDNIRVMPFMTFSERFSCKNVFMTNLLENEKKVEEPYDANHQNKILKDEYTYWADMARLVHAPYKLFSLGFIEKSDDKKLYSVNESKSVISQNNHELAWNEHRRWNAFMRSQGFECPDSETFKTYFSKNIEEYNKNKISEKPAHKDIDLKYHPCLVETNVIPEKLPKEKFEMKKYDCLDYVSMRVHSMRLGEKTETCSYAELNDYKCYDYAEKDDILKQYISSDK